MTGKRIPPKIQSAHREYDSLVSSEPPQRFKSPTKLLRALEEQSGSKLLDQHLEICRAEAEKLLREVGIQPDKFKDHLDASRHSGAWIGANMILHLNALHYFLSRSNTLGAVMEAMRLEWCRTIRVAKTWELDARIGRAQRNSGGGNANPVTEQKKIDWQNRFEELLRANPKLSKSSAARRIADDLSDGSSKDTIRKHLTK